jgi:hypothetical protein
LTGSAEYDAVAGAYRRYKEAPWRAPISLAHDLALVLRGESPGDAIVVSDANAVLLLHHSAS